MFGGWLPALFGAGYVITFILAIVWLFRYTISRALGFFAVVLSLVSAAVAWSYYRSEIQDIGAVLALSIGLFIASAILSGPGNKGLIVFCSICVIIMGVCDMAIQFAAVYDPKVAKLSLICGNARFSDLYMGSWAVEFILVVAASVGSALKSCSRPDQSTKYIEPIAVCGAMLALPLSKLAVVGGLCEDVDLQAINVAEEFILFVLLLVGISGALGSITARNVAPHVNFNAVSIQDDTAFLGNSNVHDEGPIYQAFQEYRPPPREYPPQGYSTVQMK
jgi:hypothetical protein